MYPRQHVIDSHVEEKQVDFEQDPKIESTTKVLLWILSAFWKGRVHKTKSGKSLVFSYTGGRGEVSEGSKMPNLYFGVLKRVKNGLKMAKKHIEILYFS